VRDLGARREGGGPFPRTAAFPEIKGREKKKKIPGGTKIIGTQQWQGFGTSSKSPDFKKKGERESCPEMAESSRDSLERRNTGGKNKKPSQSGLTLNPLEPKGANGREEGRHDRLKSKAERTERKKEPNGETVQRLDPERKWLRFLPL